MGHMRFRTSLKPKTSSPLSSACVFKAPGSTGGYLIPAPNYINPLQKDFTHEVRMYACKSVQFLLKLMNL